MQQPQNFVDKRFHLTRLLQNKVASALLSNFDESVAGHVLYTLVRLVHELEQLVHDSLEELPVCF